MDCSCVDTWFEPYATWFSILLAKTGHLKFHKLVLSIPSIRDLDQILVCESVTESISDYKSGPQFLVKSKKSVDHQHSKIQSGSLKNFKFIQITEAVTTMISGTHEGAEGCRGQASCPVKIYLEKDDDGDSLSIDFMFVGPFQSPQPNFWVGYFSTWMFMIFLMGLEKNSTIHSPTIPKQLLSVQKGNLFLVSVPVWDRPAGSMHV